MQQAEEEPDLDGSPSAQVTTPLRRCCRASMGDEGCSVLHVLHTTAEDLRTEREAHEAFQSKTCIPSPGDLPTIGLRPTATGVRPPRLPSLTAATRHVLLGSYKASSL